MDYMAGLLPSETNWTITKIYADLPVRNPMAPPA